MHTKKKGEFRFGQSVRNCTKIKEKCYLTKLTWKSKINQKPLIWFQDKIITKFEQKKKVSFVLGKLYENGLKNKEKCYFMKLTLIRTPLRKLTNLGFKSSPLDCLDLSLDGNRDLLLILKKEPWYN